MPPIRVFRSLEEARGVFGPCALSIGNFDGVHAAHKALVRRMVKLADELGAKPSVLTFHPHPAAVVAPERVPRLLSTPDERCRLLSLEGAEQALIATFTRDFSQLAPDEFVRRVLVEALGARAVVVGDNFRFGHQHSGDVRELAALGEKYGVRTSFLPAMRRRGRIVSSSQTRRLLEAGQVGLAARMLERFYWVDGNVVSGEGIGSRKTVPTLNLATDAEVLPAIGVYVTRTSDLDSSRRWQSITNIGYRPTFGGNHLSIETFLLDPFDGQTPSRIRVEFLHRLRDERQFESPEALKSQILRDVKQAIAWHRRFRLWVGEQDVRDLLSSTKTEN
jgi:riboflavin kinase / FMN adenylyltransferase